MPYGKTIGGMILNLILGAADSAFQDVKRRTHFCVRDIYRLYKSVVGFGCLISLVHRSEASGADISVDLLAVCVNVVYLLNVCAPCSSIFTVRVADLVAALLTFTTNTAYFGHRKIPPDLFVALVY